MSKIIGYVGNAGSGKTHNAEQEANKSEKSIVISFANPVRELLFSIIGYTPKDNNEYNTMKNWQCYLDSDFRVISKFIFRELLERTGQTCRKLFGEDIFIKALQRRIIELEEQGYDILIDDVRFPNEAKMLLEMDGEIYFTNYYSDRRVYRDTEPEKFSNWLIENKYNDGQRIIDEDINIYLTKG